MIRSGITWMLLAVIATPVSPNAEAAPPAPPARIGECGWVHGRFAVYNGSSVQRIWIIGTNRLVALRDDDPDIPRVIATYERAGPFTTQGDALLADFRVCALDDFGPGRMQHVRVEEVRHPVFQGKPFDGAR